MRVKRIVFINRAPFGDIDLDFSDKKVISLTGINGSGKTTILSYVTDAFYEMARVAFPGEYSGVKERALYRIISPLYNTIGTNSSLVYILIDCNGKDVHYVDLIGITSNEVFNKLSKQIWEKLDVNDWPIKYNDIRNQLQNGIENLKYLKIDKTDSIKAFSNNILTYFPSYRYEQPGYLNDIFQMKLFYKNTSDYSGYLINPIEITSDLPQIANWIMDVAVDSLLDKNNIGNSLISVLNSIVDNVFRIKCKKQVRIGIGKRNNGGTRLQIVNSTGGMIYPTIFNVSAGEAALLCIFIELIKQADRINKYINNVEGIVLIDEVDKHLHIKLQKEVLPLLIKMFPRIQFILSTHSPFVNMGLTDELGDTCSIIDLDNGGRECDAGENEVFRQAYEVMIRKNDRYADLCAELKKQLNDITRPVVYLEGETDEKYFNKALEVFGYTGTDIEFKWIGHYNNGNAEFTGKDSMNSAISFFKGNKPNTIQVFLFDCDTNKPESDEGNIIVMRMPLYENHSDMDKGIENALELEGLDIAQFRESREKKGSYGCVNIKQNLNKTKMCEHICKLDVNSQKIILSNLKTTIDKIINKLKKV